MRRMMRRHAVRACLLLAGIAFLPPSLRCQHYLDAQFETNIFGNYLEFCFRQQMSEHWSWGIGFEEGDLSFNANGHYTNRTGSRNAPSKLNVDIYTSGLFDALVQYDRPSLHEFEYFRHFAAGLSYYFVRIRESCSVYRVQGVYDGELSCDGPALLLAVGVFEYTPWKKSPFSVEVGVKLRIAALKLPKEILLRNELNGNNSLTSAFSTRSSGYFFPVIPLVTIGVEYRYR